MSILDIAFLIVYGAAAVCAFVALFMGIPKDPPLYGASREYLDSLESESNEVRRRGTVTGSSATNLNPALRSQ